MSKPTPVNRLQRTVSIEQLADELFSQQVHRDVSLMQVREAKTWPMRWAVVTGVAGGMLLSMAISTLLFFATKSYYAFIPLTSTALVVSIIVTSASRFLFWGQEDYKLEALKQTLKAKKWEFKYQSRRMLKG